jgi:hypothetical protein
MKRYIELVYDNSASMAGLLNGRAKFTIAQELFEKEILPEIGLPGDQVVLRLLRRSCQDATSVAEQLPNDFTLMLNRIKQINHDQDTPLFYTVFDAVEACKRTQADEHLIFVLTDGDDTCGLKIDDLIDAETLNKYVRFYKVLLVQLAIESPVSKNNLTAFAGALNGQTISLDGTDSVSVMRTKLKSALHISGFSQSLPLDYCFTEMPGSDICWDEADRLGIKFHQAFLLYLKQILPWKPDTKELISPLQLAELKFLHALVFTSGLPDELTKSMLAQLKRPYYYSYDCIYWDFAAARWKYFVKQNTVHQMHNPVAETEIEDKINTTDDHTYNKYYKEDRVYEVVIQDSLTESRYTLIPEEEKNNKIVSRKPKILKPGDLVKFRHSVKRKGK